MFDATKFSLVVEIRAIKKEEFTFLFLTSETMHQEETRTL